MKKLKVLSAILVFVLVLAVIVDCGTTITPKTVKVYQGLGQVQAFRVGPGQDETGKQIYTVTLVTCTATFDKNGKILNVYFDSLEYGTPNYDGESMPHFSGWPGTPGYNNFDHKLGKINGVTANTNESVAAEVAAWKTKRERGNNYHMNDKNEWYKQVNFYQNFFRGKTIAQIEAWMKRNCSDLNGRPLKVPTKDTKPEDTAKYNKLTAAEKKVLADVVSGATISLSDAHGDFIGALKKAYANRVEFAVPIQ